MNSQKGSTTLLTLISIFCIFATIALVTDLGRHFCTKIAVKNKLNLAVRAAAAQINMDELKNGNLVIDENNALQAFRDSLKTNLVLDDNLIPLHGSILESGPVQIDFFKVVNPGDIPYSYNYNGYTETVDHVAVVAVVSFPVKSGDFSILSGLPKETTMFCHVTAGPELIDKPVNQI